MKTVFGITNALVAFYPDIMTEENTKGLSSREKWVIERRLQGMTLEKIAAETASLFEGHPHVSRERIRQIEAKACRKIRNRARQNKRSS